VTATVASFTRTIDQLCERFEKYRATYRTHGYDESTLRLEYLNPFFKALGWDVENEAGAPPHLREVRVEYHTADGKSTRRADYVFRTNGLDRLICEAKKYPEYLDKSHFQIQNYVYNLRLWIGFITNFDELRLFVVGGKPSKDKPFSVVPGWRIHSWEYVSRAPAIWQLLAKQSVEDGSLESFIQSLPKITSRTTKQLWLIPPDRNRTVDVDFLEYLETQRARLAKLLIKSNLALTNDREALNEAVQIIIDRLLFQRVCEDRQIDTFNRLRKV
jgi:hypothetical protein